MKKILIVICIVLAGQISQAKKIDSTVNSGASESYIVIRGNLFENTGNINTPLAFANVFVDGTDIVTNTDIDGSFVMKVKSPSLTVKCTFMGYEPYEKKISAAPGETIDLNIVLKPIKTASN